MVSLLRAPAVNVPAKYDTIGSTYARTRTADPRIAARIHAALGDARTVLNVGAGTGSLRTARPRRRRGRTVGDDGGAARAARRAPAVRAIAEALPFRDGAFDAAMGVLTMHHWNDLGAASPRCDGSRRVQVLFYFEPVFADATWLVADYFPEILEQESERTAPGTRRARAPPRHRVGRAGAGAGRLRRRVRGLLLEPARGLPRSRGAGRACRASPRCPTTSAPAAWNGCAPSSRRARGTRSTGRCARSTEIDLGYRLLGGPVAFPPVLRLVLPKGSLERATLQLFEDADLAVVRSSDVDYRATIDDPRVDRRDDPAPAGDPALRRRRAVRPRHHAARLDRGDRRQRHHARGAALLEGDRAADPDRARGRGRQRVAVGRRTCPTACACTPSTRR